MSSSPSSASAGALSNDDAVRGTSDDAIISKLSAARLGYFEDPFLTEIATQAHQAHRRSPLINRGYWARVAAVDQCLEEFLGIFGSQNSQIISLGAGFDTTFFRLKHVKKLQAKKYFEIDFNESCRKKAMLISRRPLLKSTFAAPPIYSSPPADHPQEDDGDEKQSEEGQTKKKKSEEDTTEGIGKSEHQKRGFNFQPKVRIPLEGVMLNSEDYALIGADLRELQKVETALNEAGIDFSLPTLILSECVLVYMEPKYSDAVIRWAGEKFSSSGCLFVTYEQIHPDDQFGQIMMQNLKERGCPLLGLPTYPTIEAHRERYLRLGFDFHDAWTMNDIYTHYLPDTAVRRAERLELFDEFEEWHMLQGHYIISMAAINPPRSSRRDAGGEEGNGVGKEEENQQTSLFTDGRIGIIGRKRKDLRAERLSRKPVSHSEFFAAAGDGPNLPHSQNFRP